MFDINSLPYVCDFVIATLPTLFIIVMLTTVVFVLKIVKNRNKIMFEFKMRYLKLSRSRIKDYVHFFP